MSSRRAILTSIAALGLILAACSGPATPPPSVPADAIRISADRLAFSTDHLEVPAGESFTIALDNRESAPHNVTIFADDSWSNALFREQAVSGPRIAVYAVPALGAGSYAFRCDVHPMMKGTVTAG